jgi:hypothetical protein
MPIGFIGIPKATVSASRPCLVEKALLGAGSSRVYLFRPAYIYHLPVGPRKELKFGYRL